MHNFYQEALEVQDASNLSGVLHSWLRIIQELRDNGVTDTESINTHPICKLYAAKVIEMTRMGLADSEAYADAYHVCKERAASA